MGPSRNIVVRKTFATSGSSTFKGERLCILGTATSKGSTTFERSFIHLSERFSNSAKCQIKFEAKFAGQLVASASTQSFPGKNQNTFDQRPTTPSNKSCPM